MLLVHHTPLHAAATPPALARRSRITGRYLRLNTKNSTPARPRRRCGPTGGCKSSTVPATVSADFTGRSWSRTEVQIHHDGTVSPHIDLTVNPPRAAGGWAGGTPAGTPRRHPTRVEGPRYE